MGVGVFLCQVQGYLTHKKEPPPKGRHRTLCISLLEGPRSAFL